MAVEGDRQRDDYFPHMLFPRAAGILLHPTSLPSPGGIGDMGPDAFRFVRWLADAGMKIWQVLPLGPTGYGDSPYQCFSAFAGNPLLIHLPEPARAHVGHSAATPSAHVCDFGAVIPAKRALLDAWFDTMPYDDAVQGFVREQDAWLPDYALFMALKEAHGGAAWTSWEHGAARCRLGCARALGCAALTDGERVWPEGFAHYVEAHGVGVPRALVAAARAAAGVAPGGEAAAAAARGGLAVALPARNHLYWDASARAGVPLPRGSREWLRGATGLEL